MSEEVNVIVLVKHRERYIWLYEDGQEQETLRSFGRFALNPELSFTWYDAARLSVDLRTRRGFSADDA